MTDHRKEPAYPLILIGLLSWAVWIFFMVIGVAAVGRRSKTVVAMDDDPIGFIIASAFPFVLGCICIYQGTRPPER
jgi:hypothetical protein